MSFLPKVIRAVRKRANGICEGCGMPLGPSNPGECHHVKAKWKGGDNSLGNARFLGKRCCHMAISNEEARIRAAADRQSRVVAGGKKSKYPPMAGTRRSGWRKRMDGRIERR